MMEYVLAMATGDVESRPKGGWAEYQLGEHVKPALHGKRVECESFRAKGFVKILVRCGVEWPIQEYKDYGP